jgi:hypothetical protein
MFLDYGGLAAPSSKLNKKKHFWNKNVPMKLSFLLLRVHDLITGAE